LTSAGTVNITFSGTYNSLFYVYGQVFLYPYNDDRINFIQDGELLYDTFVRFNSGGKVTFVRTDYSGITAQPATCTFYMYQSSDLSQIVAGAPGGDKVLFYHPAIINARGVARAAALVNADGSMGAGTNGFGITSVTKIATGMYAVNHGLSSHVIPAIAPGNNFRAAFTRPDINTLNAYVYNNAGVLTDAPFALLLF
jgi:hypothetical protein